MEKNDFFDFIGKTIQHRHSDRMAILLAVEDGCNGGLRIKWVTEDYQISLPHTDFEIISDMTTNC